MTEIDDVLGTQRSEVLSVHNLKSYFITIDGVAKVIPKLSFTVKRREILGILGEDGSGKSVLSLSLVDLLREPGYVVGGSVLVNGFNIFREVKSLMRVEAAIASGKSKRTSEWQLRQHEELMESIRGKIISVVPENAYKTLNPLVSLEDQFLQVMITQNLPEICNSIINRESISEQDVLTLIELTSQQPDLPGRRRILNQWLTDHAIFDQRVLVMDLLEYRSGYETLPQEVFALLIKEKTGVDLAPLRELRSEFLTLRKISRLKLELLTAQDQKDTDEVNDLRRDIEELESSAISAAKKKRRISSVLYSSQYRFVREVVLNSAKNLLYQIGIMSPEKVLNSYPHDLSDVVKQKCAISLVLSADPKILVLDEPTGDFDVNNRIKILSFIQEIHRSQPDLSILLLSRDLTVLSQICERVLVLYAGNIVEEGSASDMVEDSKHPFTTGTINTFKGAERITEKTAMLDFTIGFSPDLVDPPTGCRFHPRCKFKMDICSTLKPKLTPVGQGHHVSCFLYSEEFEEEK